MKTSQESLGLTTLFLLMPLCRMYCGLLKQGQSEAEFDQNVRDITNFLDYVGEPAKLIRLKLGKWVLLFLGILFILAYLLKKEYWKDVKYGIWRPRD